MAGDTNNATHVFVRDRKARTTRRVSLGPGRGQSNGGSAEPSISANGRFVGFFSLATNLVPSGTNGILVFVRDRKAGTTQLVSLGPAASRPMGRAAARRSRRTGASSPSGREPPTWCRATPTGARRVVRSLAP